MTVFLLVVMNMLAKLLSDTQEVVAILFYRNIVAVACIFSYIVIKKRFDLLKTKKPKLHLKRSISGNIGVFLVFTAFSMLPMADMTSLMLAAPLIATLLASVLLKEIVTWQRLIIILFGFLGVLVIIKPTGDVMLEGTLVAFVAVFFLAWINVQLRELGRTEEPLTTVFYFLLAGTIITSIFMPFVYKPVEGIEFLLLAGLIIVVILSQVLKTEAMRHASVAVLTPLSYTGIVWATLFGWIIWGDFPDWTIWLGTAIIISSSIISLRIKDQSLNFADSLDSGTHKISPRNSDESA